MAARKPTTKPAAAPAAEAAGTGGADLETPPAELSAAAPLDPPPSPTAVPEPNQAEPTTPGITAHQPLASDHVELVDEDGTPLPHDLEQLFDLTHPEQTVVFARLRIYQSRAYSGTHRTVTQLLYVPTQSIPRDEFERLRLALGWE
ncbi:hypothetical protein [Streptomyces sp. FH025]|uniref:hypothetical protein n=1 Tax=Streptomyces sp. FH025 TaxID=2815937 RepID=UPI001A9EA9F8|nr:hypothetical protein [Streptomyces sp. FH025]MBO1415100.1 hypothetical protein [Streptomyces sp. FH025]